MVSKDNFGMTSSFYDSNLHVYGLGVIEGAIGIMELLSPG